MCAIPSYSTAACLQVPVTDFSSDARARAKEECLGHKVAERGMTRAMVGKAVQLPNEVRWTGGEDINVGKDNGEGTATNVSAFGEGRKGGKNQAVIQRKDTANRNSTNVTTRKLWAPVVGATQHSSTIAFAKR